MTSPLRRLLAAWALSSTLGCQTVAVYNRPVRTFTEGFIAAAPAVRDAYTSLHGFRREAYFSRALCDPAAELLERDAAGVETPLGGAAISPEAIQVRVDAVELLGRYADRLGALAADDADAESRLSTAGTALSTHLVGLAQRVEALPAGSADGYAGPLGRVVNAITSAWQSQQRAQGLRETILAAEQPVSQVLDLLERDLGELRGAVYATSHAAVITRCALYYNANRARWSDAERREALRVVHGLVLRREAFRANDPTELVRAMRDAHDALVRYVRADHSARDLSLLTSAMDAFARRIAVAASALRALREAPGGADLSDPSSVDLAR